jgi:hypothetical protein
MVCTTSRVFNHIRTILIKRKLCIFIDETPIKLGSKIEGQVQ